MCLGEDRWLEISKWDGQDNIEGDAHGPEVYLCSEKRDFWERPWLESQKDQEGLLHCYFVTNTDWNIACKQTQPIYRSFESKMAIYLT